MLKMHRKKVVRVFKKFVTNKRLCKIGQCAGEQERSAAEHFHDTIKRFHVGVKS